MKELRGKRGVAHEQDVVAYLRAGLAFIPRDRRRASSVAWLHWFMTTAIQLMVFRRGGRLLVVPGALGDTGFRLLHEVITVETPVDLLKALERGAKHAREATELPRDKRFPPGTSYWEAVGCTTYEDFVEGTTAITVVTNGDRTRLSYLVPAPRNEGLIGKDDPLELGAVSMSEIARRVLELFDEKSS